MSELIIGLLLVRGVIAILCDVFDFIDRRWRMSGAPYNPYSALSRLCYKHNCSPNDTQRVLEILAEELVSSKGVKHD